MRDLGPAIAGIIDSWSGPGGVNHAARPNLPSRDAVLHALSDIEDAEAAWKGGHAAKSQEEVILAYPRLEAMVVQRFAHYF
ncbi:MAG: hypothetical protein WCQ50_17110 [Spirochaetota bacterium]